MKEYKRGSIVQVNFGTGVGNEKEGRRPAVIISSDVVNKNSPNVIVTPITGLEHKMENGKVEIMSSHIYLSNKYYTKLKKDSVVQLEDIRSISKKRIGRCITHLSDESLALISARLKLLLN